MLFWRYIFTASCSRDSFFLHISPNLGTINHAELIKESSKNDIGSTDIQLLLNGAVKDSGVLCLLNKFIGTKKGYKPFGENFNFRDAPKLIDDKINFCKKYIKHEDMPIIIGVGDTVTSKKLNENSSYLRGGSDRSFLEFIQLLGKEYNNTSCLRILCSANCSRTFWEYF